MNNPYAAPQSTPQPPPRSVRFFTPLAVAVHAAIFPWLGAIFAAINFRRLGKTSESTRTVLLYVLPSVAIHVIALVSRTPELSIAFRVVSLGLAFLLYREQRAAVMPVLSAGAAPARWYLGWLMMLPVLFVFLVIWQFLSPIPKQ